MDIQFYKSFVAIVEAGSLTAASKQLHIAQPALSNQLKTLENEYGAKLLNRGSRRVSLTDAGQILYDKAKHFQELESSAKKEISDHTLGMSGTLRIALTFSYSLSLCGDFLASFHHKYPRVKYVLHENDTYKIVEQLQTGVAEVGIARGPIRPGPGFCVLYEKEDPLYAVFRRDLKLFSQRRVLLVADMQGLPICCSERFEPLLLQACEESGFAPNILCVNTQLVSNMAWAKTGIGLSIVPRSIFEAERDDDLRGLEIRSFALSSTWCLAVVNNCSSVAKRFCEDYLQYMQA